MRRTSIYNLIDEERARQDDKWGMMPRNNSHLEWLAILIEEIGEVAKAIIEQRGNGLIDELVQVLAVCVSWLEDKF